MAECVARDLEQFLALYDNPFWHCQNLLTTNPIKGHRYDDDGRMRTVKWGLPESEDDRVRAIADRLVLSLQ